MKIVNPHPALQLRRDKILMAHKRLRVKRTTSELYNIGKITREQLKDIRRISKGSGDDLELSIMMIQEIYSRNNLPQPSFEP